MRKHVVHFWQLIFIVTKGRIDGLPSSYLYYNHNGMFLPTKQINKKSMASFVKVFGFGNNRLIAWDNRFIQIS